MEKFKGSPAAANPAEISASLANNTETPILSWEVFVTPGIPIITPDRPPGIQETFFQAMASTLIYGAKDAVLVDAYMTVKQPSSPISDCVWNDAGR
jgi:hypothetical protein